MENHILRLPGKKMEEIILRCPACYSENVLICLDESGYYEICECKKCGYTRDSK